LKIVAEGVETVEQWELLKSLNCHYIQGYLFSKPLPAQKLKGLLQLDKMYIQP
jgi:EAL domain-containing protein (putative c-di-GMP-specific phosphodiesterase class I)